MSNAATEQADADVSYFCASGELPAHSPMTEDIADAIEYFDGSCEAQDCLWACLREAYLAIAGH